MAQTQPNPARTGNSRHVSGARMEMQKPEQAVLPVQLMREAG